MEINKLLYKYVNDGGKKNFYTPNEGDVVVYTTSDETDHDNIYSCSVYESGLVIISHQTTSKLVIYSNMEFEQDSEGHYFLVK